VTVDKNRILAYTEGTSLKLVRVQIERKEIMATRYKREIYLGPDFVKADLRVPRKIYEKACKASADAHQSFNKRIVELMEREFGEVEEETVVSEG